MKFDIDGIIGIGDIEKKKVVEAKIKLFKSEANKEWEKKKINKVGRIIALCTLIAGVIAYIVCLNHTYLYMKMDSILLSVAFPYIMYILIWICKRHDFVKNYVNEKIVKEFNKKEDKPSNSTELEAEK
mgnify:CR=1 FL=1|jgi:hypothetical protein